MKSKICTRCFVHAYGDPTPNDPEYDTIVLVESKRFQSDPDMVYCVDNSRGEFAEILTSNESDTYSLFKMIRVLRAAGLLEECHTE